MAWRPRMVKKVSFGAQTVSAALQVAAGQRSLSFSLLPSRVGSSTVREARKKEMKDAVKRGVENILTQKTIT